MLSLNINGHTRELEVDPEMPLLWALRDVLRLTGTKYGCGLGLCGACTVHIDGAPTRSCITPCAAVVGHRVTTIENVNHERAGRAVQDAWQRLDVVQCGYCQSGQIMTATALVRDNHHPSDADIDAAMTGNVCRCATYVRIRAAIKEAARSLA